MFFLKPRNVRCPHCGTTFLTDFRGSEVNQAAMKSGAALECPECQQASNYPRYADWVFGLGLLTAVVIMPLAFQEIISFISVPTLAVIATSLVIIGSALRRLHKV
ncbi:hypothetical protein [Umboniibacter marinipuniceus]|uniref:Uncharacterized protein n=1 Tax=Umboniibacter marinipuniceus TaxID=569599 RepID=A0A3M0A409_9GAMM|nr:hypothetical protein [Umboniibacter marinipuniceus]RMA79406.1 hypothetical protein DFR27_1847 [Umboniibacter marinipuniceus]